MKKDKIVGIGAILTALFFFIQTWTVKIPDNLAEPGPRLVPFMAQALMVICGVGMVIESERKNEEEKEFLGKSGWNRLGKAFFVLVCYAVALTYLGFIWSTPFVAFVLINMLSEKKDVSIRSKVVGSFIITFAFYLVFTKGFGVMLPQGKL